MLTGEQTEELFAPVGDQPANGQELIAAQPDLAASTALLRKGLGLAEVIVTLAELSGDRAALGTRATRPITSGGRRHRELVDRFETITYRELADRALAFAAAVAGAPASPGDWVAIVRSSSRDSPSDDATDRRARPARRRQWATDAPMSRSSSPPGSARSTRR